VPTAPEETAYEPPEEGLSVDADELGLTFLRNATEQGNFESSRAVAPEFGLSAEPPDDDAPAQPRPAGANLWDTTVDRVLAEEQTESNAGAEDSGVRRGLREP
jgi:hypothetical protein